MTISPTRGGDYSSFNPVTVSPQERGQSNITIGKKVLTRGQMLQKILAALDTKDMELKREAGSDYQAYKTKN